MENIKKNDYLALKGFTISSLLGISLVVMPLFDWSEYEFDDSNISCFAEFKKGTTTNKTYKVSLILFVMIISLVVIAYLNIKILHFVSYILSFYSSEKILLK